MKKIITAALLAAVAMPASAAFPAAAEAQSRGHHRDRQSAHQGHGDRSHVQRGQRSQAQTRYQRRVQQRQAQARHDRRDFRQDRNRRYGHNDWRTYRNYNRSAFRRGNWHAPFRYNRFSVGARIGSAFFGSRYIINDPWRYHLPPAGRYQVWVRHYNDLLLIDRRRGRVLRVIRNFYW